MQPYDSYKMCFNTTLYTTTISFQKKKSCNFCDVEVNIVYGHGSYYCLGCNFIAHVKCATKYRGPYFIIEAKDMDGNDDDDDLGVNHITCVIQQNGSGETTRMKHFSHAHDLILSENALCDGCMLLILDSFYMLG